jgi:periplasmic divalent cation tolerance protein
VIAVHITCRTRAEARRIAEVLLREQLIACANIHPVYSLFRWEGKTRRTTEAAIVAKSLLRKAAQLIRRVREIHSYELPAITYRVVSGDRRFLNWVETQTNRQIGTPLGR